MKEIADLLRVNIKVMERLLEHFGNERGVIEAGGARSMSIVDGVGEKTAERIDNLRNVYKTIREQHIIHDGSSVAGPDLVYEYMREKIAYIKNEELWLITVTSGNKVKQSKMLARGGFESCNFSVNNIIREILLDGSKYAIIVHNHPGGEVTPSDADIESTSRMIKACNVVGIKLLDHVIVSNNSYYSMHASGLILDFEDNNNDRTIKEYEGKYK